MQSVLKAFTMLFASFQHVCFLVAGLGLGRWLLLYRESCLSQSPRFQGALGMRNVEVSQQFVAHFKEGPCSCAPPVTIFRTPSGSLSPAQGPLIRKAGL